MATVPSPRTWLSGEPWTAAQMNSNVRDIATWLLDTRPRVKAYAGATTTHNSSGASSWVTMALNSEQYDTDAMHDNTTNNSRITCKTAGLYYVSAALEFDISATGTRAIRLLLNGTTPVGITRGAASPNLQTSLDVHTYVQLAVNDYIELQGAQNSGGNLIMNSGQYITWLQAEWRAP